MGWRFNSCGVKFLACYFDLKNCFSVHRKGLSKHLLKGRFTENKRWVALVDWLVVLQVLLGIHPVTHFHVVLFLVVLRLLYLCAYMIQNRIHQIFEKVPSEVTTKNPNYFVGSLAHDGSRDAKDAIFKNAIERVSTVELRYIVLSRLELAGLGPQVSKLGI